jgi:hypothetical protein
MQLLPLEFECQDCGQVSGGIHGYFEVAAELEEDSREGEGTHKLLAKMPSALNGINP